MASPAPVSEEDLHAFVDGEVDALTNGAILAFLKASPADAMRVEAWRRQNEAIRASFARIELEPVPVSLSLAQTRNLRSEAPMRLISTDAPLAGDVGEIRPASFRPGELAKLCAAIGIAFAGGMLAALMTPHITKPLGELFPGHLVSIANPPLPAQTLEIASLREKDTAAKAPAKPVAGGANPAPVLAGYLVALDLAVEGFQVGATPQDPSLCLFLSAKAGTPLTLCLQRGATAQGSGFRVSETPPLRSIDWPEKASHFALAGRLSESELLDLAQRIHARIETSGAAL